MSPSSFPVTPTTTYSSPATVASGEILSVAVDQVSDEVFADRGTEVSVFDSSGKNIASFPAEGEGGELTASFGLAPQAAHGDILVTDSEGARQVRVFGPKQPDEPVVERESTRSIGVDQATIEAVVVPEGLPTSFWVEYGTTEAYGESTAPEEIGSDFAAHTGVAPITGLQANTTYHWRLIAENELGRVEGPDRTLTTFTPSSEPGSCSNEAIREAQHSTYLPECRAYELVSPAEKGGARAAGIETVSSDGEAASLYSNPPFPGSVSGFGGYKVSRGASGWAHTASIVPSPLVPVSSLTALSTSTNAQLTAATIEANSAAPLTSDAPVPDSTVFPPGEFGDIYIWHEGEPLEVIQAMPPTSQLEEIRNSGNPNYFPKVAGASSSLDQVYFNAKGTLAPGAPGPAVADHNAYVWHDGSIELVGVMPNGEPASGSGIGGTYRGVGLSVGEPFGGVMNAVSAGGSRVYFGAPVEGPGGEPTEELFLRTNGEETVEVSASQAGQPDPHGGPFPSTFQFASPGGGTAYFLSAGALTNDANTGIEPITGDGVGRANPAASASKQGSASWPTRPADSAVASNASATVPNGWPAAWSNCRAGRGRCRAASPKAPAAPTRCRRSWRAPASG